MHLDALTCKPLHQAPTASCALARPAGTDEGLHSASHTTQEQGSLSPSADITSLSPCRRIGTCTNPGSDSGQVRTVVKSLQDAQEVYAKREKNLETKKLDKCPLCNQRHTFKNTWALTNPVIKTDMLSTQLTSCPMFLALMPQQKMVKVTAQMACHLCTSWEHVKHCMPGRREVT